jgi:hypothetical protein
MSKYRWAVLASVGALASACQLGLEDRACSRVSGDRADNGAGVCTEGWTCCDDDVCRRDCSSDSDGQPSDMSNPSGSDEPPSEMGGPSEMNPPSEMSMGQPDPDEPQGNEPAATSVRADVGVGGGELVLGAASVQIPAGALPELTPLELAEIELPMALPAGREPTSRVYSLSPPQPSFAQPVTIEVPVDAGSLQHMMLLELGADGWQPVSGARFESAGATEPRYDSESGTVSWTTQHGGIFVVVAITARRSSMELALGGSPYSYSCLDGGGSSISTVGDNGGMGPSFSTQNTSANAPDCPWPTSEPGLWLDVLFRNFLPSDGLPLGTWDLADPRTILPLRVRFIASVEAELPVGQQAPYQYYDSTAPVEGAEGPLPDVTYQGFYQSPLASGSIIVSRLPTVANAGTSLDADYLGTDGSLYQIELSNVTLSATDEAVPNPEAPFPPTVSISSATLTYSL